MDTRSLLSNTFQGFNQLYTQLINENFHISHQTSVNRNMEAYVLQKHETYTLLNLKLTILNLQRIFKILTLLKEKNGKILFIGHSYNKIINKIIRTTALSTNQLYYNFKLENLNYALLSENIKKLNPDLIIAFSSTNALPVLKIANTYQIPTIGISDINAEANFLTYRIIGSENSYRHIYYLCTLFNKILIK